MLIGSLRLLLLELWLCLEVAGPEAEAEEIAAEEAWAWVAGQGFGRAKELKANEEEGDIQ